jgi:hypothetical protein
MNWKDARNKYINTWILFGAIEAHSEDGKRIVDRISVIDSFDESKDALVSYKEIKKKNPERELYVANTKKESLGILERR